MWSWHWSPLTQQTSRKFNFQFSVLFKIVYVMSFIVCVSSFVVLMTLYYRSMVVWKTSYHWLIYIQITNRVVIVFSNGFGWNRKCIKGVQWKLCNLKIKLNTDQCLSNKIWGNYYTIHSVLQSWRKLFFPVWHWVRQELGFCLTHGLCVCPTIFCNIVYNLSIFFFFYTERNARLPIDMIIKQLN